MKDELEIEKEIVADNMKHAEAWAKATSEPTHEESALRNPIITPGDPQRFPLLEMASQTCGVPLTPAEEEAVVDMDKLLDALDEEAAGIAAIQIGIPRRIFLLRNGKNADGEAENNVYINPTILSKSKETKKSVEGCLSLPHMGGMIRRPKSLVLEYMDLSGDVHTETFSGFWANAVMHEMDHLNGILIARHLEDANAKQPSRTKFGMKVTPQLKKAVANRRAKTKRAKQARKRSKALGR